MKNLGVIAVGVGAIFYLSANVFRPIYDSGPPPLASRAEVEKLSTETTASLDGVKKGLDVTLEVAKAANVAAQQAVQQSQDARLTRLLQLKLELESRTKATPNDAVINDLLARTIADIGKLSAVPAPTPPVLAPPAAR